MSIIIRGTTPLIAYTFKEVPVISIDAAYLTIEQRNRTVLERDISSAIVDTENKMIYWRLSQEETLSLGTGSVKMMLNWKTNSGVRGASNKETVSIENNLKAEVI